MRDNEKDEERREAETIRTKRFSERKKEREREREREERERKEREKKGRENN